MIRCRYLLLCLMMLALPLQGFAAASMLYCGTGTGHDAKTAHTEISASHHLMGDGTGLQHHHDEQSPTTHAAKQPSGDQKHLPDSSHKCGVCAACSSAIAIVDFPLTVEVQLPPKADLAEPFVRIYAVPSRLPEKPPRA